MVSKKTDIKKPSKTRSLRAPKNKAAQPKERSPHLHAVKDRTNDKDLKTKIATLERFASFPRLNPNPVLEVDPSGEIIFMNNAAKDILRKLNLKRDGDVFLPEDINIILRGLLNKKDKEFYREVTIQDRVFGETLDLAPEFHAVRIYAHDITVRKKIQDEARKAYVLLSKERDFTSAVLSTASALVIVLDVRGRIVNFNKACEQATGYTFDEVKGKPFWDIFLIPEEVAPVKSVFKALKAGQFPNRHENYWVAKDGTLHLILWSNTALPDNKGNVEFIIGTGIDITVQRQSEEELRKAYHAVVNEKNRLKAVMEALPIGIAIVDELGGNIQANRAYEEIWGEPIPTVHSVADYVQYKALWADTGKTLMPEEWASARAVQNKETVVGQILEIERFDGTQTFINNSASPILDSEGKVVGSAVAIMDITHLKQAEKALRESGEDLNRAQAVANTGSWRMNVQRNELLWSDENHRIFGIPKGIPLTYETFLSIVHPDDREYVDRKWMAALRGEHYDIEHRIVVKGREKWVRERAELDFDKDGSLLGGFGTTQDITARKLVEEELRGIKESVRYRGN
jgi:PAS domain S-box-containing protein